MKSIVKLISSITLLIITCIIISLCIGRKNDDSIQTYEVETYMTYEEKANLLISKFSSVNAYMDENVLSFEGSTFGKTNETKISYLNSKNEQIEKQYSAQLNVETGIISVRISYLLNEEVIKQDNYEAEPYYYEIADDYYIDIEDETLSVRDLIDQGNIQECIAIADDIAVGGAIAACLVLCVVCNDPTFQKSVKQVVTTITETVTTFVKSFISWFKSVFQKVVRTIVKQVVTTVENVKTIYNITVNSIDYALEAVSSSTRKKDGNYYLALADYLDGNVYLSGLSISKETAISIMTYKISVPLSSNRNKFMLLSTYTPLEQDARSIAVQGSINNGFGGVVHLDPPHIKSTSKGTFFKHYHPAPAQTVTTAHSMFGEPYFC